MCIFHKNNDLIDKKTAITSWKHERWGMIDKRWMGTRDEELGMMD